MIFNFMFIFFAISPALSSVLREEIRSCSPSEYFCRDGGCISSDLICDGSRDCADGSDEATCGFYSRALSYQEGVLHRNKRQATSGCLKNQFSCRDGTCIPFDGTCDGAVNCPDRSDETHALCRKMHCQQSWFRCTYGACVDGSAPCNGLQECADNSDELLSRCRNETDEVRGQFRCHDGTTIPTANLCDGVRDCPDGSDETVRTCAVKACPPYLFQCAYGACVDGGADCNGVQQCADGSDEAPDLCTSTVKSTKPGDCVLPPYPKHGSYVTNVPNGKPGDAYDAVSLHVTCNTGYSVVGSNSTYCRNGSWPERTIPDCVKSCKLRPDPSVEYSCLETGSIQNRSCNKFEPHRSVVSPSCNPHYYSPTNLTDMRCDKGKWNYTATCIPECGRVTPEGEMLITEGYDAKKAEIPWHAGIYRKTTCPYMQICGGSLISNTIVISAAHCFWAEDVKVLPATNFAVAVGKIYRPWNNKVDNSQKSDVREIKLPDRFQGANANYQCDIAIVIVTTAFEYKYFVRPVCVNFDDDFERRQLKPGNKGKVAGWGLTGENGKESSTLKVLDVPYVAVNECIAESPLSFHEYITVDKICAGYKNKGSALCKGDSGGGLAFLGSDAAGTERYYLRGIASTAPKTNTTCNTDTYTAFTQLKNHEHFLKQYWTGP